MKGTHHEWSHDQRGEALPLALIALAVGALLMSPLLGHLSTGLKATARIEQTAHDQYASDAGAEYALWSLGHNVSLRMTLMDNVGAPIDIETPGPVNGTAASVRAVCTSVKERNIDEYPSLPWALWAQSATRTSTIEFGGTGHRVNGAVHSNNQLNIAGSGISVYGRAEHAGGLSVVGPGNYFVPGPPENPTVGAVEDSPIVWDIAEFSDPNLSGSIAAEAAALGKYHVHTAPWDVTGDTTVSEGIHYCTSSVSFSGSGLSWPNVTIVSTDVITVSGSGLSFTPYVEGLSFFSAKASADNVIVISGSNNTVGATYAPNGRIAISGSGSTIVGAFVGDRIEVSGSGATIDLAKVPMHNPDTERCGVFDIESTAGTTRTSVRVTECDPQGMRVLAWRLE
jgi:hypothetical protein